MGKDQISKVERERQYLSRAYMYTYTHVHSCMPGQVHVYVHVGMSSEAKTNAQGPMQKVTDPEVVNDILSHRERESKRGEQRSYYYNYYYNYYHCSPPPPPSFDNALDGYYLLLITPAPLETRTALRLQRFTSAFRKCCDGQQSIADEA